jgi:hypothetical protein
LGNVNGDAYADLLVGARFGTSLYGEAFSYHGSASGISSTASRSWSSTYYYGKFGEYVSNTGDFNGDGYKDAAISTFYDERIDVYHGGSSGLASSATTSVTGVYGLGRALATADWNNDGYDDLVAGAQAPGAYFYRGSSSGLGSSTEYSVATTAAPSVSSAGDVNNDGYEEILYGDDGASRAYVAMGGSSFPSSTKTLSRSGASTFGCAVTGGGDFDNDGYDDVVVGDPGYSSSTGRVTVFWGSSSGLSTSDYTDISSPVTGAGFGATVQWAGDVNGDGYDDLAIGDFASRYAYVYHGCPDLDGDGECEDEDCDDTDASINTSATEVCDGVDNDCDGYTDDEDTSNSAATETTFYRDADGDGYGTTSSTTACEAPTGYVTNATDCNASSAAINPGATEGVGDGVDSNCDNAETCYADADNDTYRTTSTVASSDSDCNDSGEATFSDPSSDCNDSSSAIHPGATEVCDSIDNDCDSLTDDADPGTDASTKTTSYADTDGDTYGDPADAALTCDIPAGNVTCANDCDDSGEALATEPGNDCDDGAADTYPGAPDPDYDADDFGGDDCDDADNATYPDATELDDGKDNNCDGVGDDTGDTGEAPDPDDTGDAPKDDPRGCGCRSDGGVPATMSRVLALAPLAILRRRRAARAAD